MAGIAEMTEAVETTKTKSCKKPKRARRATATLPQQGHQQANGTPRRRPADTLPSQPRLAQPPAPTSEQSPTRSKTPPRRPATAFPAQPGVVPPPETTAEESPAPQSLPIPQAVGIQELMKRASEGNATCLAGLPRVLDDNPQIWQVVGNVGSLAERHWIELMAEGNKLAEESIIRRLRATKAELAGPNPSPLEALLIDVIGIASLASMHGEIVAAQGGGSIQQAAFRQRRAESTQRRFLRAVKTLAMVRALSAKTTPKSAKRN